MVSKQYTSTINQLEAEERKLKKKSNFHLIGKLLFFLAALCLGYFAFSRGDEVCGFLAILSFFIYIIMCARDAVCQKQMDLLRRMITVCRNELSCLQDDFSAFADGSEYIDYQHEYSYDLDLFGPSSLFHRINRTITRRGSDKLAKKLTVLNLDKEQIIAHQVAISELASLSDWRIRFLSTPFIQSHLGLLSKAVYNNRVNNRFIHSFLPYVLITLTILFLLLGAWGILSWNFFSGMFILNFFICSLFGKTMKRVSADVDKLHKEYGSYYKVLKEIHREEFKSDVLKELQHRLFAGADNSLAAFRTLSKVLNWFNQRGNAIVYLTLNGILLFDVLLIRSFSRWSNRYLPSLESWLDDLAEMDALVSLSTYAFNHPANTYAELLDDTSDQVIQTTDIYHPFLVHKRAVTNNFTLLKSNISIVTGANMAGKSTFLRTIGINYILAANGLPVCASSFRCSLVSLFSSMRTTDNLTRDISYFNAELIRLEQLIRHIQSHRFTLIILDEILKGTNSKDKLEGSKIFLKALSKYTISALIATHDLELAHLATDSPNVYKNYRFEIALSDKITYSYKIEPGIAQNLNASYLLRNMLEKL